MMMSQMPIRSLRLMTLTALCAVLLSSCDMLNCTEYNSILFTMQICDQQGQNAQLIDTLTITASGTEQVLLNKQVGASLIHIPLSYAATTDTFYLNLKGKIEEQDYEMTETLYVKKTNDQFFESPDCPTRIFHTIERVWSEKVFVDSASIIDAKVNFNDVTHVNLFVK